VTRPLAKFCCVIHINTPPHRRRRRFCELLVLAATPAVDVPLVAAERRQWERGSLVAVTVEVVLQEVVVAVVTWVSRGRMVKENTSVRGWG